MFLWVEWISLEAFKSAVRKNFRFLKVVVSWLLPSEEEAVALPFVNRRRRRPGLDSFLSGIGPFPSSRVPRLPGSVPATWGGKEAGTLPMSGDGETCLGGQGFSPVSYKPHFSSAHYLPGSFPAS